MGASLSFLGLRDATDRDIFNGVSDDIRVAAPEAGAHPDAAH